MYVIAGIYICTLTLSANVTLIMLSLYYRFMITSLKCIDGSKSFFASPSQVTSHFLASPSQVTSHFLASPSQVTSHLVRRQVKSQVIWSDVKSSHKSFGPNTSQVTSHLVQTQVKSQVSLSKYKSSSTLFCPAVIRNQGQASNQSTGSYSQRYMKWSMVFNNFY